MKSWVFIAGVLALSSTGASVAATNYAELSKELEVMNSVLVTSLRQTSANEAVRFRGLETSYLAGQGVVFEVSTSRGAWGVDLDVRQFIPNIPEAPVAPIIIGEDGNSISIHVNEDWEHMIEDTVRGFEEAFREASEQMRDVRSDARELSWEVRELERRKRDLNFQSRNSNEKKQQELKEQLAEIEQEMAALRARQQELNEYADKIEAEQKVQVEKQKEAAMQADKAFLAAFEERIGDTLCRFGSGLRALPKEEHISFVLKNFDSEQRVKRDRVYVFTQKNVKDCVQEKSDAGELLQQATVYSF